MNPNTLTLPAAPAALATLEDLAAPAAPATPSVVIQLNHAPRFDLIHRFRFEPDEADCMMRTRRVLPFMEEVATRLPSVNAEKLWERIGKPHGRFRAWTDHYIKPLVGSGRNAEISANLQPTRTKPKKVYTLSRDLAAELAMQANTPEGADVRRYFLLMERCALRLSEFNQTRGHDLLAVDRSLHHLTRLRAYKRQRDGKLPLGETAKSYATKREQDVKRIVCEVLTGMPTKAWRVRFGRRIRDSLTPVDLLVYGSAYTLAVDLVEVEAVRNPEELRTRLSRKYAGKIDPGEYGAPAAEAEGAGSDPF